MSVKLVEQKKIALLRIETERLREMLTPEIPGLTRLLKGPDILKGPGGVV